MMQRSSSIRYELEAGKWPTNYICVAVVRSEGNLGRGHVQFFLDLKFDFPELSAVEGVT
ncbi:hypothetical protein [Methylophilus sp. 3sh_L]|uniref:hypothetical protein n=1 Tax=Methylophilus sp. 3sh_L TaxID=3377114 RepID=UPI00398E4813